MVVNVELGPIPSMLRVQRQFSNEYTEQILRDASLLVIDDRAEPAELPAVPNKLYELVNKADCILLACCDSLRHCCDLEEHIKQHRDWMEKLPTWPSEPLAITVSLYIACQRGNTTPGHDLRELLNTLTTVAAVHKISVYCGAEADGQPWDVPVYGMEATHYGVRTREKGWTKEQEKESPADAVEM